jgi:hypothetical protein
MLKHPAMEHFLVGLHGPLLDAILLLPRSIPGRVDMFLELIHGGADDFVANLGKYIHRALAAAIREWKINMKRVCFISGSPRPPLDKSLHRNLDSSITIPGIVALAPSSPGRRFSLGSTSSG